MCVEGDAHYAIRNVIPHEDAKALPILYQCINRNVAGAGKATIPGSENLL